MKYTLLDKILNIPDKYPFLWWTIVLLLVTIALINFS